MLYYPTLAMLVIYAALCAISAMVPSSVPLIALSRGKSVKRALWCSIAAFVLYAAHNAPPPSRNAQTKSVASCQIAMEIERSAYIKAASANGCPTFPKFVVDPATLIVEHMTAEEQATIRSVPACAALVAPSYTTAMSASNLCHWATALRNSGVGTPVGPSPTKLFQAFTVILEQIPKTPDTGLIGVWVDDESPVGFVAITKEAGAYYSYTIDGADSVKREDELVEFKKPGAKLALQTKGLKPHKTIVLGEQQTEYLDVDGERHDLRKYVIQADGSLLGFECGIALSCDTKPWMKGLEMDAFVRHINAENP